VREDLPSGTVTFVFTDVAGSTKLLQEHGNAYADLLAAHRDVVRGALRRHSGVEVDARRRPASNSAHLQGFFLSGLRSYRMVE
jgi:class 3 adenylate cyclase